RMIVERLNREHIKKHLATVPLNVVVKPDRIVDIINEIVLSIYTAYSFVIDAADLMLDLNFIEVIDELLVRSKQDVQMLVFSAIITQPLHHFIKNYLRRPNNMKI